MAGQVQSGPFDLPQGYADEIFAELGKLEVALDDDPLELGPKHLNSKVAECRKMLRRLEQVFLDVSQKLHAGKHALLLVETEFDLKKKLLIAGDPQVRGERAVLDRDAMVTAKCKAEVIEFNRLRLLVATLDAVMAVVKAKRSDLRDIQGRLRDQIRLCAEEIGLGSQWGTKRHGAMPLGSPSKVLAAESDVLDNLLDNAVGAQEIDLPTAEVPEEDDEGKEVEELAAIDLESYPLVGLVCCECQEPQYRTPHGDVCKNGHEGASGVDPSSDFPQESGSDLVEELPGTVGQDEADGLVSAIPTDVGESSRAVREIEDLNEEAILNILGSLDD